MAKSVEAPENGVLEARILMGASMPFATVTITGVAKTWQGLVRCAAGMWSAMGTCPEDVIHQEDGEQEECGEEGIEAQQREGRGGQTEGEDVGKGVGPAEGDVQGRNEDGEWQEKEGWQGDREVVDFCGRQPVSLEREGSGGRVRVVGVRRRPESMRMWYVGVGMEVCRRTKVITEPKVWFVSSA